jgi:hypothetical protein
MYLCHSQVGLDWVRVGTIDVKKIGKRCKLLFLLNKVTYKYPPTN